MFASKVRAVYLMACEMMRLWSGQNHSCFPFAVSSNHSVPLVDSCLVLLISLRNSMNWADLEMGCAKQRWREAEGPAL